MSSPAIVDWSRVDLLQQCSDDAQLCSDLAEMFWCINAPQTLHGTQRTLRNIERILRLAAICAVTQEDQLRMRCWGKTLNRIRHGGGTAGKLLNSTPPTATNQVPRNPSLGKSAKSNSLWTLLWEEHRSKNSRQAFRLLQARVLVACVSIMRDSMTADEWKLGKQPYAEFSEDLYNSVLSAKHFTGADSEYMSALASALRNAPQKDVPSKLRSLAKGYQSDRADADKTALNRVVAEDLLAIAWLIDWGLDPKTHRRRQFNVDLREPRTRGSRVVPPNQPGSGHDPNIHSPDLAVNPHRPPGSRVAQENAKGAPTEAPAPIPGYPGGITAFPRNCPNPELREASLRVGDCPDEDVQLPCLLLADGETGVRLVNAGWVDMRHQMLPWAWTDLSVGEVTRILRKLRELTDRGNHDLLELFAVVDTALWLGKPLDDVLCLRNSISSAQPPEGQFALMRSPADIPGGMARWQIPALELPYSPQSGRNVSGSRPCAPDFSLPDYGGAGHTVLAWLRSKGLTTTGQEVLFRHQSTWYRDRLAEICREGSGLDPMRVTFEMISNVLPQRILQQRGHDVVAAALISGRNEPLAFVRRFYTTHWAGWLQSIYKDAVVSIRRDLAEAGYRIDWPEGDAHPLSVDAIGGQWCPTLDFMAEAIRRLRAEIDISESANRYRFHQVYTFYSVLMLSFAIGFRGIRTPYIPPTRIHRSGIASIKDKGTPRYTYVASPARIQVCQYAGYLTLANYLVGAHESPNAPCFFIDREWQFVEVTPASMAPLLDEFLPFPANVGRHFMRTELIERGVAPEIVDAWCSHAYQGEEPWGRYSTFSPVLYRQTVEAAVAGIFRDLEFEPIDPFGKVVIADGKS